MDASLQGRKRLTRTRCYGSLNLLRLSTRRKEQLPGLNAKHLGQFCNVVQGNVATLPFHMSNESAMQVTLKGQILLGPVQLLT